MPREQHLAEFVEAACAALTSGAAPASAAGRAARRISSALEVPGEPWSGKPSTLPTCTHLAAALENARRGPPAIAALAHAFGTLAPALRWQRRAGSDAAGEAFHEGHANTLIVGPKGLERRDDVVIGASLLAPHVRYPEHQHPPEELYAVMSEGEWFGEKPGWYTPGTGGVVHHPPSVVHAMRSGPNPLLAVWCLWTGP